MDLIIDLQVIQEPSAHGKKNVDNDDHNNNLDYYSKGSNNEGVYSAVFNLTTTIIGAGIMALPATMKVLGLIAGLVMIILMGVITEISVELLLRFNVQCKATSYGEVVRQALGSPGRILAEIFIVVNNAGILVVYMIIIGDVISGSEEHVGVFHQWFGNGIWDDRRLVMLIVLIVFLAPLCALDRIESLSMSSAVSVVLAVLFVVIACLVASIMLIEGKLAAPRLLPDFSSTKAILDLLVVIPIMSNAYVCHFNIQLIYNELKGLYALTALSGYLLFGENTEAGVLTNFDKPLAIRFSAVLNYIIRVGYIFHLILVFPVIHFSLRQNVDALAFTGMAPLSESKNRCLGLTCAILGVIFLASVMIPSIWTAFKFTGATTAVSLWFICPALIALRLSGKGGPSLTSGERLLSWMMLILATTVSIVGVLGNVYGLSV
ncbi:putative amino acid transporter, transmembrane domain-containing protein [Helianthus debilis subsp. tardiflorus]